MREEMREEERRGEEWRGEERSTIAHQSTHEILGNVLIVYLFRHFRKARNGDGVALKGTLPVVHLTGRQTERQTDGQTDTQREKQTEKDRQTGRETDRQTDGQTDRKTDR